MLTKEKNERLVRVGAGTPGGELLRRYWWPVAISGELDVNPVRPVRLLGEDLALFRTDSGKLGLVGQRCAHRGVSLVHGIPEEDGLRCAYHGWRYGFDGQCNETPGEPAGSTLKNKVCLAGYPVEELGGLIFAYLGPAPAPLLPRWDLLVREDLEREVGITRLPINWVHAAENTLDPIHLEFLHTKYMNYVMRRKGLPPIANERHHLEIAFDPWDFGIIKRRLLEGDDPETSDEWLIGHPLIFPNTLALGNDRGPRLEYRVPVDDTNLLVYSYFTRPAKGPEPRKDIPFYEIPYKDDDENFMVDTVLGQDMMAWVTQGEIADRTTERLGTTDRGIIMFRQMVFDEMDKVEGGEDPLGVIRDADKNTLLVIPRERDAYFTAVGGMVAKPDEFEADPLAVVRKKREVSPVV